MGDCEGGVHGSFCIVAVSDRRTEGGHHTVTNMLVDVTSVLLHDAIDTSEELLEDSMNLLGIGRPAQGRVTGQIGEKDRDLPAGRVSGRTGKRACLLLSGC